MTSFQPRTILYESLPSTNTEAARLAIEGAAEGLTIVAEEQTAGRGRLQRNWSSPKGAGLYFSMLLRPVIATNLWPLITFAAALAIGDALSEVADLQCDIKWPNDLLAGERKICGILSETVETPIGRAVVVGIGVNLRRDAYPGMLEQVATSVEQETGRVVDQEKLVVALQRALVRWYSVLQQHSGTERIAQTWMNRSSYAVGKAVEVVNGAERFRGVTRGIEADGALRVSTDGEEVRLVRAGDVIQLRQRV